MLLTAEPQGCSSWWTGASLGLMALIVFDGESDCIILYDTLLWPVLDILQNQGACMHLVVLPRLPPNESQSQILHFSCWSHTSGDCPAECHKAKNLVPESGGKPTKVGEKVLQLQRLLPLARVVYCSATGEPALSMTCWQQP